MMIILPLTTPWFCEDPSLVEERAFVAHPGTDSAGTMMVFGPTASKSLRAAGNLGATEDVVQGLKAILDASHRSA